MYYIVVYKSKRVYKFTTFLIGLKNYFNPNREVLYIQVSIVEKGEKDSLSSLDCAILIIKGLTNRVIKC